MAGSPPHTWRIQLRLFLLPAYNGNTSTYVENTTKTLSFARIQWDHLHIRGEYYQTSSYFLWTLGSPPHTWRIPNLEENPCGRSRITSTYVENTYFKSRIARLQRDHLHIRGEYSLWLVLWWYLLGSPPHTWRIPYIIFLNRKPYRITSTYVENTAYWRKY